MPGFAVGCPQRLAVRRGDSTKLPTSILHMAADPTDAYLAILTRHDVQIWSGGHHQLLLGWATTELKHAAGTDDEDDDDIYVKPGVVWNRSSKEVCVLGLDGVLTFFEVIPDNQTPLITGIEPPEWMDLQPGGHTSLLDSPNAVHIRSLRRLELPNDQRATCLSAGLWSQHLLLGKDRETAILDVAWPGTLSHEYQLRPLSSGGRGGNIPSAHSRSPPNLALEKQAINDVAVAAAQEEATILLQVCYSDICHLLAAVLSDGSAIVSNIPSSSFSVKVVPPPPDVRPAGVDVLGVAEAIAFSPVDAVLAIGYDDGSVAIFRIVSNNTYMSSPSPGARRHRTTSFSASTSAAAGVPPSSSSSMDIDSSNTFLQPQPTHPVMGMSASLSKLGFADGPLYPTGESDDISLSLYRRLSLSSLGFEMKHVGPVMTMEFSPDGGSLSVAHAFSSLNVWDTSQWCRPMTTFPRVPATPHTPVMAAISCLLWVHKGYRLLVAHNEVSNDVAKASIVRYEMLKWARHAAMADTTLCLQGMSSVAFLEQRAWNPRLLSWAHVTVPPAYIVNVPVSLVALSPSGHHIALAGRRGLALYNRSQRKWRLFGNVHQERDLQVAGLTWWGEDAIIIVAKQRTSFVIWIYPRQHLDKASLLNEPVTLPPGTRPLFLDCVMDRENTAFRARSRSRVPNHSRHGSAAAAAGLGSNTLSTSGTPIGLAGSMSGLYWSQAAVLMVGDSNFLLFYRIARDHSPTGVSITFLYDLQVPVRRNLPTPGGNGSMSSKEWSSDSTATGQPSPIKVGNSNSNKTQTEAPPDALPRPCQSMGSGESPRRVVLLPDVHPRTVAILSSTGTLYRVEVRTGLMAVVAKDVSSFWELCLPTEDGRMRPCYVLYCGDNGFSLWLPSLREEKALQLTHEACQVPFLDPTFNPDVEGVMMGIHGPTSSLIFLTQSSIQPQPHPSDAGQPIAPRFEVGLQRRPIYQVAFRFLLFLHSMLRNPTRPRLLPPSPAVFIKRQRMDTETEGAAAKAVAGVVAGVFDELFSQPETRIQLADALDFLVRSCIEAVASAHSKLKKKTATRQQESYFTSLSTSTEQVREALVLCRREPSLNLFYEVIVRVARKVEPSRQRYIFPLPDLDGQGYGDTPVSLFEKCLASKKLHTALLYLPLIDPTGSPQTTKVMDQTRRARIAANTEELEDLKLVHELSLRLLWECLRRGRREWRMLKQLWRFIEKREEALAAREEEAKMLLGGEGDGSGSGSSSSSNTQTGDQDAGTQSHGGGGGSSGRPILGFLYRVTVGMLAPSGAGSADSADGGAGQANGGEGGEEGGVSNTLGMNGFLTHLPGTAVSRDSTWMSPVAGGGGGSGAAGGPLTTFDLLKHASCGRDVLTLFSSMCLGTLRLREMVDAFLLLGAGDPRQVPYPSLTSWIQRGQIGHQRYPEWPWLRFEAPGEVVLDSFLAIREQFTASSDPRSSAASSSATSQVGGRKRECTVEERLSILGRVCVELRDYDCLLALGTFLKDSTTVSAALKRSKLEVKDYRGIFLDETMEATPFVKDFVDKTTAPQPPLPSLIEEGGGGGAR